MKKNGSMHAKKGRPDRWDASKHHPTKAELEEDLSIPEATPEKLAKAVSDYDPNKRG